jgi:hypothetical protein
LQHSPPGVKEYNGLAESHNKIISNKVVTFFSASPWVPQKLWAYAWQFADITQNMCKSNIKNSNLSRVEAFTNQKPNWKSTIMLPFGQPVEAFIPKEQRKGKLSAKSFTGMYLGPSDNIAGTIMVYNPITKQIVDRDTYRIIPVPENWIKQVAQPIMLPMIEDVESNNLQQNSPTINSVNDNLLSQSKSAESFVSEGVTSTTVTNSELPFVQTATTSGIAMSSSEGASIQPSFIDTNLLLSSEGVVATTVYIDKDLDNNLIKSIGTSRRFKKSKFNKEIDFIKVGITFDDGSILKDSSNSHVKRTKIIKDIEMLPKRKAKKNKKKRRSNSDSPTLEEAMKRSDWPDWEKAITLEYSQMRADAVFHSVKYNDIPAKGNIIGSMMILQLKRHADGSIDKYKARLVGLGNQQRKNSYDLIKSPTARSSTAKMFVSIQAKRNLISSVIDVKGAYLKAQIKKCKKEKLYLKLPDGSYVQLQKYIYGLKQAGKEWNDLLSKVLVANHYFQSVVESCVFYRNYDDENYIMMCTHVDDFYIISTKQKYIDDLIKTLEVEFGSIVVKSGNIIDYLGMQVSKNRHNGTITLSQPGYINKILKSANIENLKPAKTPCATAMTNQIGDDDLYDKNDYLKLIGSLNYLAVFTRPDILYALSTCAQKCTKPTFKDFRKVRRIFCYLLGTIDKGITFSTKNTNIQLQAYVDASFNCYEDGKGHLGITFSFGDNDGAFYSKSQKMKVVTLSSAEAEYVALCEASTEIVFLRNLLNEIGFIQEGPTKIFEDNKPCIDWTKGLFNHKRSKHISPKYHYTRELVKHDRVKIIHCNTKYMVADVLTKALHAPAFRDLRAKLLND